MAEAPAREAESSRAFARVSGEDLATGLNDGVSVVDRHRHLPITDDDQIEGVFVLLQRHVAGGENAGQAGLHMIVDLYVAPADRLPPPPTDRAEGGFETQ